MNRHNLSDGQSFAPIPQQQAMQAPFQWGKGGRRMTADQIAREREIAEAMSAVDYSPIHSPWQGLARLGENIMGGLRARDANKAEQSNLDYSDDILQSLMNPGGVPSASGAPGVASPAPGANTDRLAAILGNPYASPQVKAVAEQRLKIEMAKQSANLKSQFDTWDDNAGNRWRLGANGMPEMIFHDRNAKRIPQKVFDADGNEYIEYVEVPNAYGPNGQPLQPQAAAPAPMAELPAGYTVEGPPSIDAAPPPPGADAMAKARAEADAWMKLNGITR